MKQVKKVLAVVLALAMMMAMSVMVFAENAFTPEAQTSVKLDGNKYIVSFAASGKNMGTYDYGVAFNAKKMSITEDDIEFDATLAKKFDMTKVTVKDTFAVAVGVASGDVEPAAGTPIVTFTFTVKDGETIGADDVVVTTDSMKREISANEDGTPVVNKGTVVEGAPESEKLPVVTAAPTEAPATDAPATDAPQTAAPQTAAPATVAPATVAPATAAPAKTATPKTADTASVAIPVVAIVAAAAAVVAVSKKRVEE